ncbi:hypothetical protein DSL72_006689 [Monilinia vaccinii-corymbosi]|uniref:Uncharacterized protein n=1 Tax=Monilinia vaccinii-corymbosi TaxID=61207 RepID=A0A8A3PPR1_9HELO|nr:hypothetical protein DSL72_006689 [Monilinia vaccinii-corymbosi]
MPPPVQVVFQHQRHMKFLYYAAEVIGVQNLGSLCRMGIMLGKLGNDRPVGDLNHDLEIFQWSLNVLLSELDQADRYLEPHITLTVPATFEKSHVTIIHGDTTWEDWFDGHVAGLPLTNFNNDRKASDLDDDNDSVSSVRFPSPGGNKREEVPCSKKICKDSHQQMMRKPNENQEWEI